MKLLKHFLKVSAHKMLTCGFGTCSVFVVQNFNCKNHTSGLIGKLGCVIGKFKKRSVCMQSTFLLFCCRNEKSMHANSSPSSTSTTMVRIPSPFWLFLTCCLPEQIHRECSLCCASEVSGAGCWAK